MTSAKRPYALGDHSQQEIADTIDASQQAVGSWASDFTKMSEVDNFVKSRVFAPPLYNVWKQQAKNAAPEIARSAVCDGIFGEGHVRQQT